MSWPNVIYELQMKEIMLELGFGEEYSLEKTSIVLYDIF